MRTALCFGFVLTISLGAASLATARACLDESGRQERATGKLSIGRAKDANGRPARPYILTLSKPACLTTEDPEDKVQATRTIHVFSTDDAVLAQIGRLVGKPVVVTGRPFPAHTAHHHAPVVMNLTAIALR